MRSLAIVAFCSIVSAAAALAQSAAHPIVLRAARVLDVETGRMISPGEILVRGERIGEIGSTVSHPADAWRLVDLGDRTLMPGLIDVHVHLFACMLPWARKTCRR